MARFRIPQASFTAEIGGGKGCYRQESLSSPAISGSQFRDVGRHIRGMRVIRPDGLVPFARNASKRVAGAE